MHEAENIKLIQAAFASFSRGEIQGVLSALAPDVDWMGVVGAASQVPMRGPRHGVEAVPCAGRQSRRARSLRRHRDQKQRSVLE